MRRARFLLTVAALPLLFTSAPAHAQESGRPDGMRFLTDVGGQFEALTTRPDALGFHIGESPDPSSCMHYQGLVRIDAADGTPYFLVTRSGNYPIDVPEWGCDPSPGENGRGNLLVVRMSSRDKHGERLRSNRLERGRDISDTEPPAEDTVVTHLEFNGTGLPNYGHPGGMQAVGHMLAMTVEHPYDPRLPRSAVLFFDVSNPEVPVLRSRHVTEPQTGGDAGVVGVTPLPNGLYLMVVTGGQNQTLFFYRSTTPDLSSTSLSWEFVGTTPGPDVDNPHQTLHFLRQRDVNGRLYLAGARGRIATWADRIDLYRVMCETPDCAPGEQIQLLARTAGQRIFSHATIGDQRLANLAAASSFYVSPGGELIFYATEHENDGPGGTVKAGEWRHVEMVRNENSPTLQPQVTVGGPYTIDEGGHIELTGLPQLPITKAWIQLYSAPDFNGDSVVIDYEDRRKDDFASLWLLDNTYPRNTGGFANRTVSWRWFAPPGCAIRATDYDGTRVAAERTMTDKSAEPDLRSVLDDRGQVSMFQIVDSIQFAGCEDYYNRSRFTLHWDLDRNGSYETVGYSAGFSAAAIDGPAVVQVPVEARHDLGGPAGRSSARIVVRNVAPRVTAVRLFNSAGQPLSAQTFPGSPAPSVLINLPIAVQADFLDPGVHDRQTAAINWGDGTVDPYPAFGLFDDTFADGSGTLSHTHRYTTAGLRSIAITVRDDDGGSVVKAVTVNVIGAAQAVELALVRLDMIIAATSDQNALSYLTQARRALAGTDTRSLDGALPLIRAGRNEAAIGRLNDAISVLKASQVTAVGPVISVLQQAIDSLSAMPR